MNEPALLCLLQGQAHLIQSLKEKVNRLSEAPENPEDKIPPLSLKELHKLSGVWNHPQLVTRSIYFLKCAILKQPLLIEKMHMTHQWNDESQKPLCLLCPRISGRMRLSGDTLMGGDASTLLRPLEMNTVATQTVEAPWMLPYSSVYCYNKRYETDSTSSKQASSNPDFSSGLTPAWAHLKKVTKKRFKVVDGVEFFELHRGEWVQSDSSPVGPRKTFQRHGVIERHWVWTCPRLE